MMALVIVILGVDYWTGHDIRLEIRLISELREKVKTLEGILPICASCKSIRTETGAYEQIEAYVSRHSEAQFSHGICPECMKKLYPEHADKILNKSHAE
jgi:hypothetical protein